MTTCGNLVPVFQPCGSREHSGSQAPRAVPLPAELSLLAYVVLRDMSAIRPKVLSKRQSVLWGHLAISGHQNREYATGI